MTPQENQKVIEVLEWLTNEKSEFSIMYGNQDKRFSCNDKDYTIDEIIEIFETRHNYIKKHTFGKVTITMTPQDKQELRFILKAGAEALIALSIVFLMLTLIFKL
jgi:hypothetical protein